MNIKKLNHIINSPGRNVDKVIPLARELEKGDLHQFFEPDDLKYWGSQKNLEGLAGWIMVDKGEFPMDIQEEMDSTRHVKVMHDDKDIDESAQIGNSS